MNRVWLRNYPQGVPETVDIDGYSSLVDFFERCVESYGPNKAFSNMGSVMTYADVDEKSRAFAAYLQQELGLSKGERLAIMMPNVLQYPVALLGALRAGLIVVNINPLYTAHELRDQLKDSGARAIVILENFAHVLAAVFDETPLQVAITTGIGDFLRYPKSKMVNFVVRHVKKMIPPYELREETSLEHALKAGSLLPLSPVTLGHRDLAFLQYTGGTTGVSKGAMLSHGNMVANVLQASSWMRNVEPSKETIVTALPLYHIFALTANCLTWMNFGGLNHLITNPRDLKGFVRELKRMPFTTLTGVNTLFQGLLRTPGFANLDFSHLKISLGGGMAVHEAVAKEWQEVTGCPLLEAYGLTETSPAVSINPLDGREYNGTIGLPLPSTDCRVIDSEGHPLPQGEVGELCVKGPQVMMGYWNRPDETEKVLDGEGWLRTGDMATIDDDGYMRIVDRKKDMILVSGFNVYPNEVEQVVSSHPGVLEVGAIGVPDEKSDEAVMVVVVKKDPSLTTEELRNYCRDYLTGYKVPRYVEFRDELPKSNVGKVLRRELRALVQEVGQEG